MKISVIIEVTSENFDYFPECLDSVVNQEISKNNLEIIILGKNVSQLEDCIKPYQINNKILYIKTDEFKNSPTAWNNAIKQSSGDFLMFCDVKSRLNPKACEILSSELLKNENLSLVYGETLIDSNPRNSFINQSVTQRLPKADYQFELLIDNRLVGINPMWRKNSHQKIGYFNEHYNYFSQHDFWIRIGEISNIQLIRQDTELFTGSLSELNFISVEHKEYENLFVNYQKKHHLTYFNHKNNLFYTQYLKNLFSNPTETTLNIWKNNLKNYNPQFEIFILFNNLNQLNLLNHSLNSICNQYYNKINIKIFSSIQLSNEQQKLYRKVANYIYDNQNLKTKINENLLNNEADFIGIFPAGTQFQPETFLKLAYQDDFDKKQYKIYYTDEDLINTNFQNSHEFERYNPKFKPDFNLDFFTSSFFTGQACFFRSDSLKNLDEISSSIELYPYDLTLKILEIYGEKSIAHITLPLIHFDDRNLIDLESYHDDLKQKLIDFFKNIKQNVIVSDGQFKNTYEINYIHNNQPLVSIIIPNKNRLDLIQPCLDTLFNKTSYKNFEVIIVDNQTTDQDVLNYYELMQNQYQDKIRFVLYDAPFNFSAQCNLGVEYAQGEYILLLNNDTEIIQNDWLDKLMSHGQRKDVGIVGAMLLFPDETIQHAGVILGVQNTPKNIYSVANHIFMGNNYINQSYLNLMNSTQECSAVTGACLLTRKNFYQQVSGMNAHDLPILFNDIDFCLKIRQLNYKIIYTPYSKLIHKQGITSKKNNPQESSEQTIKPLNQGESSNIYMLKQWINDISNDIFYNPNCSLIHSNYFVGYNEITSWEQNYSELNRILMIANVKATTFNNVISHNLLLQDHQKAQTDIKFYNSNDFSVPYISQIKRLNPTSIVIDYSLIETLESIYKHRIHLYKLLNLKIILFITSIKPFNDLNEFISVFKDNLTNIYQKVIVFNPNLSNIFNNLLDNKNYNIIYAQPAVDAQWFKIQRLKNNPNNKIKIGYFPSFSQDIAEKMATIMSQTHQHIDWIVINSPYAQAFQNILGNKINFANINQDYNYPQHIANLALDFAILPREINHHNQLESNLELIQLGALGIPVMCSKLDEFLKLQNDGILHVENTIEAWFNSIVLWVNQRNLLENKGLAFKKVVEKDFNLETQADLWIDYFS